MTADSPSPDLRRPSGVGAAGAGSGLTGVSSQTEAGVLPPREAPAAFPETVNIVYDRDGKALSRSDVALMQALLKARGRTVSHEYLIGQIQAYDDVSTVESLRVILCHLRKKVPEVRIKAHKGWGYYAEAVHG